MNKEKEGKTRTIRIKFSVKIMAMILIIALLIYISTLIVGRHQYDRSIKEYYDQMAYQSAAITEGYFTQDEIAEYAKIAYDYHHDAADDADVEKITQRKEYKELLSHMYHLRESVGANDIFIVTVDMDVMDQYTKELFDKKEWNPLYYIADSYENAEDNYLFGDAGTILPEFLDIVKKSYEDGERYDGFYISEGYFGYNMTAMHPVVKDGKTIAFIGVEIPMLTLEKNINRFVQRTSLTAAMILVLVLLLGVLFSYRSIIRPVRLITSEVNDFVGNNTKVSDSLKTIHTKDEIQTLSENLYQMEIDINSYIDNLQKVTAEKERIGAELNVATQIQADMLPQIFPAFPDRKEFDIYATMTPAKEVGGDFYDFFLVDDDHLALVMADVSGKGVPAALFMVIAKTLIKNRAQLGESPTEVLENINNQLCEGNEAELFVTVWLAIIEISTGKGMAANAGHEHPALRHADGTYELIKYRHSPAVATMEGIPFREHAFELQPGDSLFVYTDGVTEATNAGNVLFGEERMVAALNRQADADPETLLSNVKRDIDAFVAEAPQFDDITMLGMVYHGKI